ncbi:MAG: hypothetical protein E7591_01105 [Ruminococcaceae bacterium]|nr:hypothetical protein [Oscillospiraceae bacterium]
MNFKTVIELKQHTPLIHFQANESGATLRASEVKPKLDKFIIERLNGKVPENWLVGFGVKADNSKLPKALNYKLRFEYSEKVEDIDPPERGIYYGNMGKDSIKARFVFCNTCTMTLICFNSELTEVILHNICDFFIVTNFGRMQNKGFGSFTVQKINDYPSAKPDNIPQILCRKYNSRACYGFSVNDNDHFKRTTFDKIKILYSVMKSGCRINDDFEGSFLFKYLENINNESTCIRPWKYSRRINQKTANDHRYVRCLLGMGEIIRFKKEGFTVQISNTRSNKDNLRIERLPSPVFFKIIENNVYIIGKNINQRILSNEEIQTFKFFNKKTNEFVSMKTPDNFDTDNFLEAFFNNYFPVSKNNERYSRVFHGYNNFFAEERNDG